MQRKALVLDANILIRAVLGQRVRRILEVHADGISFFLPETAYTEAEEHLAALVVKRGGDPAKALRALKAMAGLATIVGDELYEDFEAEARKRLGGRDPRTGRFWRQPSLSAVRSGQKTPTSSDAAWPLGHPGASTFFLLNSCLWIPKKF
jgi:hypothetical protein